MVVQNRTMVSSNQKNLRIRWDSVIWWGMLISLNFNIYRISGKLDALTVETERNQVAIHEKIDNLVKTISEVKIELEKGQLSTSVENVKYTSEKIEKEVYELGREFKLTSTKFALDKRDSEQNLESALVRAQEILSEIKHLANTVKKKADKWVCQKIFMHEMENDNKDGRKMIESVY